MTHVGVLTRVARICRGVVVLGSVMIENTGVAPAEGAADAVRELDWHGPHLRPAGTDRFTWTAKVLDAQGPGGSRRPPDASTGAM